MITEKKNRGSKKSGRKLNPNKQQGHSHVKAKTAKPLLPGKSSVNLLIFLLCIIATVVLYGADLNLGFFAVDDTDYVVRNPWIKAVTAGNLNHIFSTPYFANYSPLHLLSYSLDHVLGDDNAFAYHLSSNIWAGIVAGFVFLTALALTRNRIVSVAAAILFIVHPVHVEAIAWISSRKDLVAAAFALPSFLAYLKYRNNNSVKWYIVSLICFTLSVLGKLSVATFPVVFFLHDVFVEKRPFLKSAIDKIPFLVLTVIVGSIAASAQPSMGHQPDPYVLSATFLQNGWLLSGFASYVLYRVPPQPANMLPEVGGAIFLVIILIAPYFLRKKFPVTMVLLYWILLAFIPAQVLSFTHPVTDRYMFFPSVAAVIIACDLIWRLAERFPKWIFFLVISAIAIVWTFQTVRYLNEWKDPRSVWYGAMRKSSDPTITQNLGTFYVGVARTIETPAESKEQLEPLATVLWQNDNRLSQLRSELSSTGAKGQAKEQFRSQLLDLGWEAFEKALQTKGDRVMSALFYNRGLILMEKNDLQGARKEFSDCIREALKETFAPSRNELLVYCHASIGNIAVRQQKFKEALSEFTEAKNLQQQSGAAWLPQIDRTIEFLQRQAQ